MKMAFEMNITVNIGLTKSAQTLLEALLAGRSAPSPAPAPAPAPAPTAPASAVRHISMPAESTFKEIPDYYAPLRDLIRTALMENKDNNKQIKQLLSDEYGATSVSMVPVEKVGEAVEKVKKLVGAA